MSKPSRGPWLWPLALTAFGVALLIDNFLLLGEFRAASLWPLVLVLAGAHILLRGDLLPSTDAKTFGITRGSVEAATLEISAGEIDVQVRALKREGRLIAGQYAAESRPQLISRDTHVHLKLDRAYTPWYSFADWEMGLARDLPWQLFVSTYLGQVNLDLADLIVEQVVAATGLGDIGLVCPREALEPLHLRSTLGNIRVVTPPGYRSRIHVSGPRMFRTYADERRYEQVEPGVFEVREADGEAPLVEIFASGTFGDAYLA